MWEAFNFVGVLGLEPRMTGPESVVLPLHHTPKSCNQNILVFVLRVQRYYFFINYHFAGAKVLLFYKLPKLLGENL